MLDDWPAEVLQNLVHTRCVVVPVEDKPWRSPLYRFNPGDVLLSGGVPDCAGIFYKRPNQRFVGKVLGLGEADLRVSSEKSKDPICLGNNRIKDF